MKKYRTVYKVYDDFGELVRVVIDKPTDKSYTFTVDKKITFDTDNFEEALF